MSLVPFLHHKMVLLKSEMNFLKVLLDIKLMNKAMGPKISLAFNINFFKKHTQKQVVPDSQKHVSLKYFFYI